MSWMKWVTTLAIFSLLPFAAYADDAATLAGYLQPLKAMDAQFEQLTLDSEGSKLQESRGNMSVARGNQFYWHTLEPDEQLVVANGNTVWIYDPGLEQVVVKSLDTQLTATPALLFGGDLAQIRDAFTIRVANKNAERIHFVLLPKDDQAMFSQLEVSFDGQLPTDMRLEDSLGQATLIEFHQVKLNATQDVSKYTFNPPDGVDVIQQQHD